MQHVIFAVLLLSSLCSAKHDNCEGKKTYPVIEGFSPSCERDGSLSAKQCFQDRCWCVDEDGVEIQGTHHAKRDKKPNCSEVPRSIAEFSTCQKARHDVLINSETTGLIGRFVPSCQLDGAFEIKQCHASTGHCWCVNTEGKEIEGTRRTSSQNPAELDCSAPTSVLTPCQLRRHQAALHSLIGLFSPACEVDGSYSPKQCHASSGHCWCVRSDGMEIEGTRRAPADNSSPLDCSTLPKPLTACQKKRLDALEAGLFGSFVPVCEQDGSFAAKQCHASTGSCWCVGTDGEEIVGSHQARQNHPSTQLFCGAPAASLSACQLKRTRSAASHLIGSFVPVCREDGSYSPKQCHASTGNCWCVNEHGDEIQGTRMPPSNVPDHRMCASPEPLVELTECQQKRQRALLSTLVGSFLPLCETDGTFAAKQCHASTGHCWCVSEDGVEIEGSRRTASEAPVECEIVRTEVKTSVVQSRDAESTAQGVDMVTLMGCVCVLALAAVAVAANRRRQMKSGVSVTVPYSIQTDV